MYGRVGYIFQMKYYSTQILFAVIMLSFLLTAPSVTAGKINDFGYDFKIRDQNKEQLKFLIKLKGDKQKVEMAIENTSILIDKSRNMPYLPELYLRLAELYIEKSRFVFFIRKNEIKSKSEILNNLEAHTLKTQAIETYQKILNDFPNYEERDKIHFFMAHEYRELNQIPEMLVQYRAIIVKHSSSRYVPECYLLLGDHFLNNQDLDMAIRHYSEVLNYPESSAIAIARYKLAWGHVNKGELKKAIKLFELSVKVNKPGEKSNVDTYKRVDIKLESLVDMAFCYPDAYKKSTPSEAIRYFQHYSWSRQVFTHILEKLGYRYLVRKKYRHAVAIYRELSTLHHDEEKLLEYARHIFECVKETGDFKNFDEDMAYIVNALKKQKYSVHIDEETKKKNLKDYELYARDIATHLHKSAKKSNSVESYRDAAESYRLYLDFFRDSNSYHEIQKNYAEALFSSKQYIEAGRVYEKLLVAGDVKNKGAVPVTKKKGSENKQRISPEEIRRDIINSAIISYYNALKNRDNLNYYETAYARNGLAVNGNQYVKDYPNSPNVPDILFNVAWIAYDEGKYDEAIQSFTDFIKKYPNGKAAESAVSLVLDAYHQREDYEGLVTFGREILTNRRLSVKSRKEIVAIVQASESKLVSLMTVDAMNDWELGKEGMENLAERNKATALGEQALNALIISSSDKAELGTVFSAGYKLIKHYPESKNNADVMGIMIDSAAGASQFRIVAKYLEEFTLQLPKHAKSAEFIRQAAQIRQALGQQNLVTQDFEKYLRISGKGAPGRTEAMFAMSENGNFENERAAGILKSGLKEMPVTESIRAEALLAEYYRRKGKNKTALKYRKYAYKKYKKRYAEKSPEMNHAYSAMLYNSVHELNGKYMDLKLGKTIDNSVVAQKAKLLEKLENGYIDVINHQSPEYVLRACYSAGEINLEFARFLKESPLPELTEEQKKEYRQIIFTKAKEYSDTSEKYMATCIKQAHKWELCDPELVGLYDAEHGKSGTLGGISSSTEIAEQFLKDEELKKLHYALAQDSGNLQIILNLSDAYFERNDYYHAKITAQQILENPNSTQNMKAKAYENIGISNLYLRHDDLAKAAFEKAIELNHESTNAKINLAGILSHYQHRKKAIELYGKVSGKIELDKTGRMIHPVAKELYSEFIDNRKSI